MLRVLVIAGLAGLGTAAANGSTTVTLSALADEDGGVTYDALAGFTPNEYWTLAARVGYTTSSEQFSDFSGTTYGVSADLHNEHFGARLGWRSWDDSSNFTSNTLSGKLYWRRNELEVGLLLEQKDFSVQYSFVPLLPPGNTRPVTRTADFSSDGVGLGISWYGEIWGGYAQFQDNSYGRALNTSLTIIANSDATRRPQLIALAQSVVTRSSAIADNELSVGIDRSFNRSGLRLDAYRIKDQISGGDSTGASLGYRYSISPKLELEATVGGTDSDNYESQLYGGLAVSFRL